MIRISSYALATTLAVLISMGDQTAYGTHLNDPFGGAGNHSLAVDNFDGGSSPTAWPFVSWTLGQVYTSGTIEFDLYMEFTNRFDTPPTPTTSGSDAWWTYVDFRVGETGGGIPGGVTNNTMIFDTFRAEAGGGQFYFENGTAPANGHPFSPDTAAHVKFTIDDSTVPFPTYTVEVTPHAVAGETHVQRAAGVDANPWRTGHILDATFTGFDTIALGSAFGLNARPFYIDNMLITSGGNTLLDENFDDDPIGGLADTPNSHFAGAQDQNGNGFKVEVVGAIPEPTTLLLSLFASTGLLLGVRRR